MMPESAQVEQGPQMIVLRSLFGGGHLPGLSYPLTLTDLELTRSIDGRPRLLDQGLTPDTRADLIDSADVELWSWDRLIRSGLSEAEGVIRSEQTETGPGQVKVRVEVCGLRDQQLRPWERLEIDLELANAAWRVRGNPLHLAT